MHLDFGDLTQLTTQEHLDCSNATRAINVSGGSNHHTKYNGFLSQLHQQETQLILVILLIIEKIGGNVYLNNS